MIGATMVDVKSTPTKNEALAELKSYFNAVLVRAKNQVSKPSAPDNDAKRVDPTGPAGRKLPEITETSIIEPQELNRLLKNLLPKTNDSIFSLNGLNGSIASDGSGPNMSSVRLSFGSPRVPSGTYGLSAAFSSPGFDTKNQSAKSDNLSENTFKLADDQSRIQSPANEICAIFNEIQTKFKSYVEALKGPEDPESVRKQHETDLPKLKQKFEAYCKQLEADSRPMRQTKVKAANDGKGMPTIGSVLPLQNFDVFSASTPFGTPDGSVNDALLSQVRSSSSQVSKFKLGEHSEPLPSSSTPRSHCVRMCALLIAVVLGLEPGWAMLLVCHFHVTLAWLIAPWCMATCITASFGLTLVCHMLMPEAKVNHRAQQAVISHSLGRGLEGGGMPSPETTAWWYASGPPCSP